ncbi:MAG: hypothetical protein Q8S84_00245 [bacterium]|nr:hypothetical protein [bacterium]MDP3380019.1 hypothetical protein [bacterium]
MIFYSSSSSIILTPTRNISIPDINHIRFDNNHKSTVCISITNAQIIDNNVFIIRFLYSHSYDLTFL